MWFVALFILGASALPGAVALGTQETDCEECLNGGIFLGDACECPEGFSGIYCEVEATEPYIPCENSCNNGYCDYTCGTCVCHPFNTGEYCDEILITPCSDYYCFNGGECLEDENGTSYCVCKEQFEGEYCMHQTEFCFCLNGGYGCDNGTSNGTCVCPENYTGEHCEIEICTPGCMPNEYCCDNTCQCQPGYTGENCTELLWEECGDYYCFNGATCQNDTCQCAEGFGGDYCLYNLTECEDNNDTSHDDRQCGDSYCVYGYCINDTCECFKNATGVYCEFVHAPISPPVGFAYEPVNSSLSWEPPLGYEIFQDYSALWYYLLLEDRSSGVEYIMDTDLTNFVLEDLAPGTHYCVSVRAITSGGFGVYSEKECFNTTAVELAPPCFCLNGGYYNGMECVCVNNYLGAFCDNSSRIAPSAPLNLTFPPGGVLNDSITLTWSVPEDPSSGVRVYQLRFPSADGDIYMNTIDNTPMAVLSDLTPGTQYNVSVRAFTVVFGPFSDQLSLHTANVPSVPQVLHASSSGSFAVLVTWMQPAVFYPHDNSLTMYEVQYRGVDTPNDVNNTFYEVVTVSAGTELSYNISGLMDHSAYNVSVRATNQYGVGTFSEEVTVRTEEGAPSAPLNLTFSPGGVLSDSIALTWFPPQHPNGVIHFYQLQRLSSDGEVLVNTTTDTTTIVLSDLTPGTQYNVSVRAFTVAFGPFSDQLTLLTADVPSMPQAVTADSNSSSAVFVTWMEPAVFFPHNNNLTTYEVQYRGVDTPNDVDDTFSKTVTIPVGMTLSHTIPGLMAYSAYNVSVRATNQYGVGGFSEEVTVRTEEGASSAPLNLSFTPGGVLNDSITLTWLPPQHPNGVVRLYERRLSSADGDVFVNTTDNTTTIVLSDLTPGTQYTFSVRAFTVAFGPFSDQLTLHTADVPSVPQRVIASANSSTTVLVTWMELAVSFPHDNSMTVYEVQYRGVGTPNDVDDTFFEAVTVSAGMTLSHTIPGLMAYSAYNVSVRATNQYGVGDFSEEVTVRTEEGAPSAPLKLTFPPGGVFNDSITITWILPDYPNGIIRNYQLQLSSSGVEFFVNTTDTTTTAVLSDLTPGTQYNVSVRAFTVAFGPFSDQLTLHTADVPSVPQGVMASSNGLTALFVTWMEPAVFFPHDNSLTTYEVQYRGVDTPNDVNNTFYEVVTVSAGMNMSYDILGLVAHSAYNVSVRATNQYGVGDFSEEVTARTEEGAPSAPLNLTFPPGGVLNESITLTWSAPQHPNGLIHFYQLQLLSSDGEVLVNTTTDNTTIVLSDLIPGTQYNVSVRAFTVAFGPFSDQLTLHTAEVASVPQGVSALSTGSTSVLVTWREPAVYFPHDNSLTVYEVQFRGVDTLNDVNDTFYEAVTVSAGMQLSYNISGLLPYSAYIVSVRATNQYGVGNFSEEVTVRTAEGAPSAPLNLTFPPGGVLNESITLTWSVPQHPNGVIRFYQLQLLSSDGEVLVNTTTDNTTIVLSDLTPGTQYNVSVRALTVAFGPFSDQLTLHTADVPSVPQGVSAFSTGSTSVSVTWREPAVYFPHDNSLTTYDVQYRGVDTPNDVDETFYESVTVSAERELSYNISGLLPYSAYNVSVRATNQYGVGDFSEEVTVRTEEEAPSAPLNLTFPPEGVLNDSVTLMWLSPLHPNGVIQLYELRWSSSGLNVFENTTDDITTAVLSDLTPGTQYSFSVRAFTVAFGPFSDQLTLHTADVPSVPQDVSALSTDSTTVLVTWMDPTVSFPHDNSRTTFEVQYRGVDSPNDVNVTFNEAVTVTAGMTLNLSISDLMAYSAYNVSVRATNQYGVGGFSEEVTVRTEAGAPSAPLNLTFPPGGVLNDSITLTWIAPQHPNGVVRFYELQLSSSDSVLFLNTTNMMMVLSDLTPGTQYTFSVRAFTVAFGPFSDQLIINTADVPLMPQVVRAVSDTSTTVTVYWREPAVFFPHDNSLTTYEVQYRGVDSPNDVDDTFFEVVTVAPTMNLSVTISGLLPYSAYNVSVRATNQYGVGDFSEEVTVRTEEGIPSAPLNVTLRGSTSTSLQISWSTPSFSNGANLTYRVEYTGVATENAVNDSFSTPNFLESSTTSVTISGLVPFSTYTIGVSASTSVGAGPTASINATTAESVPSAPLELRVTDHGSFGFNLEWDPPSSPNGIIDFYQVKLFTENSLDLPALNAVNVSSTSYNFTGLAPFTGYSVQVCAYTVGCGDVASLNVTTLGVAPVVAPSDGVSNKPISMGDPVTISFTIVNEPVPIVTRDGVQWVFSGIGGAVNLSCTSTSKYSFSDNCLSLTVSNTEGSDAGQYQIVITTEAGIEMGAVGISVSGVKPSVFPPLMDATLPQGGTHMFVCTAVADPFPFFTFRFNGERVTSNTSERILVTSSTSATLTLYNLQREDEGTYNCSVSNRYGSVSTAAVLSVQVPPTITFSPSAVRDVVSGETLTASCDASADPAPVIQWFRGDRQLKDGDDSVSISQQTEDTTTNSRITVMSFTPEDAGVYSCVAVNDLGNDSRSFQVNSVVRPNITGISSSVNGSALPDLFHQGMLSLPEFTSQLELTCEAYGIPSPEVVWLNDGIALLNVDGKRAITVEDGGPLGDLGNLTRSTLILSEVQLSDAGEYTCRATSGNVSPIPGTTAWTFTFQVTELNECDPNPCLNNGTCVDGVRNYTCNCASVLEDNVRNFFSGRNCSTKVDNRAQPSITTSPSSTIVQLHDRIALSCSATGNPTPSIAWYKDGKQIKGPQANGDVFVIPEATPKARGFYHCEAFSSFGDPAKSKEARILIEGIVQFRIRILFEAADSSGKKKRQATTNNDIIENLRLQIVNQALAVEGNYTATVYSVEPAGDNSSDIVITVATDSSESPANLTDELIQPLEQTLEEVTDINEQISFAIMATERHDGCPKLLGSVCGNVGSVTWPETEIGEIASVPCRCGIKDPLIQLLKGIRRCGGTYEGGAMWEEPQCDSCIFTETRRELCALAEIDSPAQLASVLVGITDSDEIESEDVSLTVGLLDTVAQSTEDLQQEDVQMDVLSIVSNVQQVPAEELAASQGMTGSSNRILEIVDDVLNVVEVTPDDPFQFSAPDFGVRVEEPPENLDEMESFSPNLETLLSQVISSTTTNMEMSEVPSAAVTLSSTLLQRDDTGKRPRISTSVFARDSLFRQRDSFTRRNNRSNEIVGGIVLDLTLRSGGEVRTVSRPPNSNIVRPRFTKSVRARNEGRSPSCRFWNFAADEGFGAWDSSSCRVVEETNTEVECGCDHLTHFAILLDISPEPTVPSTPPDVALTYVSYIGTVFSIIGLFITIITYLGEKKLRNAVHVKLLLNLCFALLGLYVTFIISTVSTGVPVLCGVVSALMHYFFLAVFFWMAAEAIQLHRKLVSVFKPDIENYPLIAMAICWVVPAFIVIFSLAPYYHNYIHPQFCRVHGYSFYIGLLVPFGVIYIMNWVIFILIFGSLVCRPNVRKETSNNGNLRKLKENFLIALGLSLLFGMGWAVGLLASSNLPPEVHTPAEWIFTILNAFLGVYLFVLYVLRSPEARNLWKRWLLCQSKRIDHSRSSTRRTWTSTLRSWGGTLKRGTTKRAGKRPSTLTHSIVSASANIYSPNPSGVMPPIASSYAEPSYAMGVTSPSLSPVEIELLRLEPDGQSHNEELLQRATPFKTNLAYSTESVVKTMAFDDNSSLLGLNAPSPAQSNSSLSHADADCYIVENKEAGGPDYIPLHEQ